MITIKEYNNTQHRDQVKALWVSVFHYKDARNNPELSIDKKMAVNDGLFFVAIENENVIGTIMAGYDGHRGWIYSLAVIPEKRKTNIGTKLLQHAEAKLKALGCVKINLQIISSNNSVVAFYKKNGYVVEERISMGKTIEENIM